MDMNQTNVIFILRQLLPEIANSCPQGIIWQRELRYAINIRKTMGEASLREVHRAVEVHNRERAFSNHENQGKLNGEHRLWRQMKEGLPERETACGLQCLCLEHILINGRNISQKSMSDQILETNVVYSPVPSTIISYALPLAYNLSALGFQPASFSPPPPVLLHVSAIPFGSLNVSCSP